MVNTCVGEKKDSLLEKPYKKIALSLSVADAHLVIVGISYVDKITFNIVNNGERMLKFSINRLAILITITKQILQKCICVVSTKF